MADWYANSPVYGNQILTTTSSWNYQSNSIGAHPVSLYFGSVPLEAGKQVAAVTLPTESGGAGTTAMHIFAMATGNGTPTAGAPYSSLSAAYDNVGITDNSNPAPGNFDGTGESYSAEALAAGTPTALVAGGQATIGGTTFTWPSAASGTPDNVVADGQTIDLTGSGTDLGFLGAGAFGEANGTGTITYTDGSTQQFSIALNDWYNNAAISGDQVANTTPTWNFSSSTQTDHPVSIYFASVPLEAGKTVASVTLPTVSASAGDGVNAMHIFSIATGTGTPTSG
jgi:beta-glucosidase